MDFPFGEFSAKVAPSGALQALAWGARRYGDVPRRVEDQLKSYFKNGLQRFDVALDCEGTVFQKRVWAALREIPYGQVVTYGELAKTLKTSARAVGGAVGANPVPIIVPCHRVVGENGRLVGFSAEGGVEAKRFLLELEGVRL